VLLGGCSVDLTGVLHGDQRQPFLDHWSAHLGANEDGKKLLDLSAERAVDRHCEQPVIGAQRVAVVRDPQVARGVEGDVVRAGDRTDLVLQEPGDSGTSPTSGSGSMRGL
jgi:hypothetical protein